MYEATLSSRGQVTIPVDIRRMMKLRPEDRVSFTPVPNRKVLLHAKNKSFAELRGLLAPERGTRVSIDDMNLGKE